MTPPWGINWQRYHADQQDMPHIAKMGYASFTIYQWMWSNRDFCNELLSVARKDAIFLNRDHPLSEQKDDLWKSDPARKGRNHADDWAQKVKEGRVFTPLDRTYFLGLNEPDSNEFQRQIDAYNEAYCRRMAEHGLRAAAYSFGVGHPSTVDLRPDTPPDWSWYKASAAAVLEGHHLAALHEYGAPTVGGYGWGFWCNRSQHCPYAFDVVLDECGIDNGVVKSGQLYGYAKYMNGEQYADWLDAFQRGMAERASTRKVKILGYNIFSFDHGSGEKKDWHSFDIRPMRPLLEAYQWSEPSNPNVATTTPSPTVHIPSVIAPGPTPPPQEPGRPEIPYGARIVTTVTANLREWSSLQSPIIREVPPGTVFDMVGYNEDWYQVPRGDGEGDGWLHRSVVKQATPPPQSTGDKWQRTIAFILKEEGGYTPNDEGAPANFGINQAANPDLDVKNITREQAIERYRTKYWIGSGADKLEWPFCLLVMDAAVQHGESVAANLLFESNHDMLRFQGLRQLYYSQIKQDSWQRNGRAWMARMGRLLVEASR